MKAGRFILVMMIVTAAIPIASAQSFIEAQLTMVDDGSAIPNLVARPVVNISGRWNLQGLAWVSQDWAQMYVGPQYIIISPADIKMFLSVAAGLEQADQPYRFACIGEAVGARWEALTGLEYGGSGWFYKAQFSHKIFGTPDSFIGLGGYSESLAYGPRLTWTKTYTNQIFQGWCNVLYNDRTFVVLGGTYFW